MHPWCIGPPIRHVPISGRYLQILGNTASLYVLVSIDFRQLNVSVTLQYKYIYIYITFMRENNTFFIPLQS